MPQARLPDINTAYITYRREVISSLKSRNYSACFGSLYALNGLLPVEYRVKISSIDYEEKTRQDIFVICKFCKIELDFKTIKVFDLLLPLVNSVLSANTHERIWVCTACNKNNRLEQTDMKQKILSEPYFLRIVPKPPQRKDGLMDRSTYHSKIAVWIWTFLDELEERMAQFRDDNWSKGDESESLDFGDTGEETDAD